MLHNKNILRSEEEARLQQHETFHPELNATTHRIHRAKMDFVNQITEEEDLFLYYLPAGENKWSAHSIEHTDQEQPLNVR